MHFASWFGQTEMVQTLLEHERESTPRQKSNRKKLIRCFRPVPTVILLIPDGGLEVGVLGWSRLGCAMWGSGPRGVTPLGWYLQQVSLYNMCSLVHVRTQPRLAAAALLSRHALHPPNAADGIVAELASGRAKERAQESACTRPRVPSHASLHGSGALPWGLWGARKIRH